MKTKSDVFNMGVECLRNAFDGTDVLILSDLYRQKPNEYYPAGKLGADIWVEGIEVFMGHSEMEDVLVYGKHMAEEIIGKILYNKNYGNN